MSGKDIQDGIDGAENAGLDVEAELNRLAALSRVEYETCRVDEAKRLGFRVSVLDDALTERRLHGDQDENQGETIAFDDPLPWPEPVDGADLLDQIAASARRYIVLPRGGPELLALWTVHTHAVNAFYHTPRLAVTAPEKGCGKSVVLDFLDLLVPRPVKTENVSTAVVFRLTSEHQPVLLCDEVDTYLKSRDELVGILNGGHKRGAKVYRCEGESNKVKGFKAFAAVATAGIGKLPATLGDRSIPLRMRRAGKDERIIPLRQDRAHHEKELKRKAMRWAADHFDKLSKSDPETPDWMFNRAADNWRPLFAVADAVGGAWPERARNIAAVLSNETVSEESYRLMALRDLDNLFRERAVEYLLSEEVVEAFKQIEERPWADWKGKNGFTTNQLARLLEEFDIRPKAIKAASSRRGYQIKDCKAVFAAYLPPQTATPLQPNETAGSSDIQTATKANEVAVINPRKPAATLEGSGVAVCKGDSGREGNTADENDGVDRFAIPPLLDRRAPLLCETCREPVVQDQRGITWLRDNGLIRHKTCPQTIGTA